MIKETIEQSPILEQEPIPTVFYGAAIQGAKDRSERANIHRSIMSCIAGQGFKVMYDHTGGRSLDETKKLLGQTLPDVPQSGIERKIYIRKKMLEGAEGDISAAVFEVSEPSLGTGMELAHAYLRPRMNISAIPILILYQEGYWPNNLSTMVDGISEDELPNVRIGRYKDLEEAQQITAAFLHGVKEGA